jgi:thymidylate synthase (FAD)
MNNVKLIWGTPDAEQMILYMARVSNPKNQKSGKVSLLRYLIEHQHWSPFEMASMCVEINTSRAISAQILRHRSFSFQEFSQRYAEVPQEEIHIPRPRSQDPKNRQNSIDNLPSDVIDWWMDTVRDHWATTRDLYAEALAKGIAKEVARFLLPLSTTTKLYMTGTLRSWIHYLAVRTSPDTQLEHREIAQEISTIFAEEFPIIYDAIKGEISHDI